MRGAIPSEREIAESFATTNCAQVLFGRYAAEMGITKEVATALGNGLGGGLRRGMTCDSYLASVLILGAVFRDDKARFEENRAKFDELYAKRRESKLCRELLGHDLSTPEGLEAINEKGLFTTLCPCIVRDCIEILDSILEGE